MPTGRVETAWFQESVGPEAESQPCHSQPGDQASHLASPMPRVLIRRMETHYPVLERRFPIFNSARPVAGFTSARKLGVSHWRGRRREHSPSAASGHHRMSPQFWFHVSGSRPEQADEEPVGLQTTLQSKGLCRPGAAPPHSPPLLPAPCLIICRTWRDESPGMSPEQRP